MAYAAPAHAQLECVVSGTGLGLAAGLALPRALQVWAAADAAEQGVFAPRLACFVVFLALFHTLEFVVTAVYAPSRVSPASFLLRNGEAYWLAMGTGALEWAIEAYCGYTPPRWTLWIGLALVATGQILRSLAMMHAAENFSHVVATDKRAGHELVTTGVYAYSRHPSYVGFFYWALGTQVVLANPVSAVVFAVVLGRFFRHRIRVEEAHLRKFFPEYAAYAATTPTLLGFV